MANIPANFPFLVGGPPNQAEERAGGADCFPGPPNLPLITGAAMRHWPLYDNTTRTIRMWRSVDNGGTWAELDSASAPIVPANGTGPPAVKTWQYYNAVWDGADKVYVVAWSATFFVALFPFTISANVWAAPIVSTLTYLDQTVARVSGFGGMAAVWRPSDRSVWMAFQAGGADASDCETLWSAKCIPGGAGWDGALTRIGGALHDGLFHTSGSLALDPATNKIHAIYQRSIFGTLGTFTITVAAHVITANAITNPGAGYPFPQIVQGANIYNTTGDNVTGGGLSSLAGALAVGAASALADGVHTGTVPSTNGNGSLVHRVINTDDTLTAEETVFNFNLNGISNTLANLQIQGGQMMFCFAHGNGTFASGALRKVARALISDPPATAWEISTPAPANGVGDLNGVFPGLMDIVRQNGVDYLIYGYQDVAGNEFFKYSTSTGVGDTAWAAGISLGFADNGPGPVFYGDLVLAPLVLNFLAFGVSAGSDWGMGYWELALGPAVIPILRGPFLTIVPFPIKKCLSPRTRSKRELVHCVSPSKNGHVYVPTKTALIDRRTC